MIRICSRKRPDRCPARPALAPATERSWHGLPPQTMSTGVSFAPSSLVISPTCCIWGNRNLVTAIGKASISLAQTGSMPLRTAARGKPPMPSNRLPIVIFLSGASGLFSSFLIFSLLFQKKFFLSHLLSAPIGKGGEHFLRFPSLFIKSSQFECEKRAISANNFRKNRPQSEACGFKSSLVGKISLGSTSKNGQQKTPKPLKFRGFLGGYLFRIHNMACGSEKDISRYCFEKYSFS